MSIYWRDVRIELSKHCPKEATEKPWNLKEIVEYLNKTEGLSLQAIARLTKGKCGRTSLYLAMKRLSGES